MSSCKTFLVSLFVASVICIFVADAKPPKTLLRSTNAIPGELKYQVALRRRKTDVCGGTLISNRHVLTAAHCFIGKDTPPYIKDFFVVTGATNLTSTGEEHPIECVTVHPDYVQGNASNRWRHDIAIIKLAAPIVINSLQAPIALPTSDLTKKVTGLVSGWGQLARGHSAQYPDVLQKSQVTILPLEGCREYMETFDTQICGLDGKDTGFCSGDSGGPLAHNNQIVGIVSFGVSCGLGYPDIYTRVYAYLNFIKETMERKCN